MLKPTRNERANVHVYNYELLLNFLVKVVIHCNILIIFLRILYAATFQSSGKFFTVKDEWAVLNSHLIAVLFVCFIHTTPHLDPFHAVDLIGPHDASSEQLGLLGWD